MNSRKLAMRLAVEGVALAVAARGRATLLEWGATANELRDTLPGDDVVVDADLVATRGITIDCGPDAVWPWIVQLGQEQGGFYSYDCLENLVGCDIHSSDRIVPSWQHVQVGDEVKLAPKAGLLVAVADTRRVLVLHGNVPVGSAPPPFDFSWAFVLREGSLGTTRLVVRERYRYLRWWTALLVEPVELISFVMSQKMLRGIRERSERSLVLATPVSAHHASPTERSTNELPSAARPDHNL